MKCAAGCGVDTLGRLCAFCRRTMLLIRERRCVSCTAPIHPGDSLRTEGKCGECMERLVEVSAATRWLLRKAANARLVVVREAA